MGEPNSVRPDSFVRLFLQHPCLAAGNDVQNLMALNACLQ